MDASARSLGSSPAQTFMRVHLPILTPSVLAASLLVLVDVMKELPATLVLRPFNFDTLAVIAYQMASDERLGEGQRRARLHEHGGKAQGSGELPWAPDALSRGDQPENAALERHGLQL